VNGENSDRRRHPHGAATLVAFAAVLLLAFGGFVSLGVWQLQRLGWKLDLIERVEARAHAAPVPLPARPEWARVSAVRDEYRRVRAEGRYLPGLDARVQAVTVLGAGFWVLSPFQLRDGSVVLVNRGFVPPSWVGEAPPAAATEVIGLLRLPEPGGAFLRENDPAADRWHSRDVAAIAAARGLARTAPFFIDAEAAAAQAEAPQWPRAGLTVLRFSNNHLVYALTWFALALLVAWAGWRVVREERKLRG
jgi:surfeit locus 1 family protein